MEAILPAEKPLEYATSMFPPHRRKSPDSLEALASFSVLTRIDFTVRNDRDDSSSRKNSGDGWSQWIERTLPAVIRTRLLAQAIPTQNDWRYPCLKQREHTLCLHHRACQTVYNYCDLVLGILLRPDITRVCVDLRRIAFTLHENVISRIHATVNSPVRLSLLICLQIQGGSPYSDHVLPILNELAEALVKNAPHLLELSLPVCSNLTLLHASNMPKLISFQAERTKKLNRRGLWHLCHPDSISKYQMEVLELGVFKHEFFRKLDVAKFFTCMKRLKKFSLRDEERNLVRANQASPSVGGKILTYSVIKLGIVDAESGKHPDLFPNGEFKCQLKELKVVDRHLKPEYLLTACPDLEKLTIDWQEDLAWAPFRVFSVDWFSQMILSPCWRELCLKLSDLELVLPLAHGAERYSLPLEDFSVLIQALNGLKRLKIRGAGGQDPLPLSQILQSCPDLEHLILERTSVTVPQDYEVIEAASVCQNLKAFAFVDSLTSVATSRRLTSFILHYMPNLERLELQPETTFTFSGLKPRELEKLAGLLKLTRLSVALSLKAYIMNLPEIIFILRKFPQLRYLVISWGKAHSVFNEIGNKRMTSMTHWLQSALISENANIHLEIDFLLHGNTLLTS